MLASKAADGKHALRTWLAVDTGYRLDGCWCIGPELLIDPDRIVAIAETGDGSGHLLIHVDGLTEPVRVFISRHEILACLRALEG